ncbi:MAG: hypothetical protein EXS64_16380 [Candidatus Latescibacteria bacterium]|nr:hypothetical protein [Candidatus Latescibacterota bacterium]
MADFRIPWAPRVLLAGRTFRLPVQSAGEDVRLEAGDFRVIASKWSARDSAMYYYLRAPEKSGDCKVVAQQKGRTAEATVQVRSLDDLRCSQAYNGAPWPRRWPLGKAWTSAKTRQTLQDMPEGGVNEALVRWWAGQSDLALWGQLPNAEIPKAHFVNAHQGCPKCGTAVFKYGGFYPWTRNHLPCDFRSTCPSCGAVFPSNDLTAGDFVSGDHTDDGYGYFDAEGHIFLFAATYHRDQTRAFAGGVEALTARLRSGGFDAGIARQLGLMLLRYAVEEIYVSAVPQFRYGPTLGTEQPWDWGQTDWASQPDPVAALFAKGTIRYCIDTPYVCETLALAYDTIWPFLREDGELASRARALGLSVARPEDAVGLVEEMLACLLQCTLDLGARSNLPRESEGALAILRSLDRSDAQDVMDWLYDEGPDRLRTFGINDFFPDGMPHEATGGYNSIHYNGLFDLEYHVRGLRALHPAAYPESRYPSLMDDPRVPHVARAPHEITMIGKSYFQFGDGSAPGTNASGRASASKDGSIVLTEDCFHDGLHLETVTRAADYTGDPAVREVQETIQNRRHRRIGTTVQDGVGIAILRTGEVPERAAVGILYGDTTVHRHRDLLDVHLFAFQRAFLTDLGYPQSWATPSKWEGNWATHNTVWGIVPGAPGGGFAGRGRLVRTLFAEGVQILDVEADRWAWDRGQQRWHRPGVMYRRLIALVETDGEGVALVDLSRIRGGTEHWRVCRGLEGGFVTEGLDLKARGGTVESPDGVRGEMEGLGHPDYEGLACMDDVAEGRALASWKGGWQSRIEPGVHLDLHQVRASFSTTLMTARATAVMGKPEESNYEYRAVVWRRRPSDAGDVTCVDLVFEPRAGEATLSQARAVHVTSGDPAGSGVELVTRGGRQVVIYWSPEGGVTRFSDGTELRGALATVVDGQVFASGVTALQARGKGWTFEGAHQQGRIAGLDRKGCTVDVEGLRDVNAGDRIFINPEGRGHTYGVEGVTSLSDGRLRLKLDVTSLLGRAPVVSAGPEKIELGRNLLTRTGNLHGTRLEADSSWAEIAEAVNPGTSGWGSEQTTLWLDGQKGDAGKMKDLAAGTWVSVVDYVAGDTVLFEPARKGQ